MYAEQFEEYGQPLTRNEITTLAATGDEVLVKITHRGVCHSDVHIHDGYFGMGGDAKLDVRGNRPLPFTLGHEIVGEVEAVGPTATGVSVGDKVSVYPWIGCGTCPICERDEEQYCTKPRHLGVVVDGGFASHVVVPHGRYCIDYAGVSPAMAAALACSGLTAYSALKRLGTPASSDSIVIVGAGGVGMMGIQFAKAMFGKGPIVVDIDEAKLEAAKAAGASDVVNGKDADAVAQLMVKTGGGAFGSVDFVGNEASFGTAHSCLRKGGSCIVVGLFGGAFSMPITMFPLRAISMGGSFVGSLGEFRDVMKMAQESKVSDIPMEHRPLSAASKSLDDLRAGTVIGRVILED